MLTDLATAITAATTHDYDSIPTAQKTKVIAALADSIDRDTRAVSSVLWPMSVGSLPNLPSPGPTGQRSIDDTGSLLTVDPSSPHPLAS